MSNKDLTTNDTWKKLNVLEKLVQCPGDKINVANIIGETFLYMASRDNTIQIVKKLLRHSNIAINRGNINGITPLHIASKHGYNKVVEILLNHPKIEPNQVDNNYLTPLMRATIEGRQEIVQLLLFHPRIDVNKVDFHGKTALSMACENGRTNISKILLSCPATDTTLHDENDQSPKDLGRNHSDIISQFQSRPKLFRSGHTCCSQKHKKGLQISSRIGNPKITKSLLQCLGMDINNGYGSIGTPLYIACRERHVNVVEILLNVDNIDVNKMVGGENALLVSAEKGHLDVIELLLDHHDIDTNIGKVGNEGSALYLASKKGYDKIVKQLLLQPQIEVNAAFGGQAMTPLIISAKEGYPNLVKLLLRCPKTMINTTENSGKTAREISTDDFVTEAIDNLQTLIQSGRTCCFSANEGLLHAATIGDYRAIRGLSQCPDADINNQDRKGRTPLYLASLLGHTEAVKQILKQNDTDLDKGRFFDELIPFSIASEKGHHTIMAELIKFKQARNAKLARGWHTDKWAVYVLSSHATPPTVTEPTIERNVTGMKLCYNNTIRNE